MKTDFLMRPDMGGFFGGTVCLPPKAESIGTISILRMGRWVRSARHSTYFLNILSQSSIVFRCSTGTWPSGIYPTNERLYWSSVPSERCQRSGILNTPDCGCGIIATGQRSLEGEDHHTVGGFRHLSHRRFVDPAQPLVLDHLLFIGRDGRARTRGHFAELVHPSASPSPSSYELARQQANLLFCLDPLCNLPLRWGHD